MTHFLEEFENNLEKEVSLTTILALLPCRNVYYVHVISCKFLTSLLNFFFVQKILFSLVKSVKVNLLKRVIPDYLGFLTITRDRSSPRQMLLKFDHVFTLVDVRLHF